MSWGLIRLALLGSRRSWGRLSAIVAGIMVGTAALMLLAGGFQGLQTREDRSSWLQPVGQRYFDWSTELTDETAAVAARTEHYGELEIARLGVATTPTTSFAVPGMESSPRPGTYYASPALVELVASVPAEQLGDRFGELSGVLPDDVLLGPDALVAVVGQTDDEAVRAGSLVMSEIVGSAGSTDGSYRVFIGLLAVSAFFPILLFVSIVTQLGAAQRAERFATLRLIGAAPDVVQRLVAVETFATGMLGALLGVGAAMLLRPFAARASLDGQSFFAGDLTAPVPVLIGGPFLIAIGTTLAAMHRLRRTGSGPLGATREILERPMRSRRLVPLAAGLTMLGGLVVQGRVENENEFLLWALTMGGFALTTVGLVVAGPWLTLQLSTMATRRARSAEALIAGCRLRRHPVATFRSVSGLVVAVFLVTVFAVASTGFRSVLALPESEGLMPPDAFLVDLRAKTQDVADEALARVSQEPGVTHAAILYVREGVLWENVIFDDEPVLARADDAAALGVVVPERSVAGEAMTSFVLCDYLSKLVDRAAVAEPVADLTSTNGLEPLFFVVRTSGDTAAMETVRTALSALGNAETRAESAEVRDSAIFEELLAMADAGTLLAIVIAGCSLAVATASAMLDRRRVFGLLRLVGMPAQLLRRIVVLEAVVPLVAVLGVSVALGAGVAWSVTEGTMGEWLDVGVPETQYFVTILAGLALALVMVVGASSTIRRETAVSSTRFE